MRAHTPALFLVLLLASCAPTSTSEQHDHGGAREQRASGDLYPGLGNYRHPITTKSAEAQTYFDQGLTLLYGFNHDEAAKYFERASKADPDAAMPYWGLALAVGPNYNDTDVDAARAKRTYEAVQAATARASKASAPEQDYIRALAKRYPSANPKSDWKKQHLEYSNAMRALVKKYPDDLDAATMFAESLMMLRPWQLWSADGKPAPNTLELVAVLESVMKRNPDHPGANHFYIHAVEASPNLERAIPSAVRLMGLVPGAGHLVHMPGHIFLQTGDYDLAALTNEKAAAADKSFVTRTGATGVYPLMYWTHNLHFIAFARAQQGRYEDAREAAEEMTRNVGDHDLHMQMLEGFHLYPLMIEMRFLRWNDILKTPEPRAERKLSRAFWRYARAMALIGEGKTEEAAKERGEFETLRKAVPHDSRYMINNKSVDILAFAAATLDAKLAWARGDKDRAIQSWRQAVKLQGGLAYDEPPPWFYSARQSLGAALLQSGRSKEAEAVFREALAKQPREGRLLFGLWQSLKAERRDSEAALVEQQFRAAWKDATVNLRVEDL
jgi:tetratricopeptide (TPR) repeat protein